MYNVIEVQTKSQVFFDVKNANNNHLVARFSDKTLASNFANYLIRNMITNSKQWDAQPNVRKMAFKAATGQFYPWF